MFDKNKLKPKCKSHRYKKVNPPTEIINQIWKIKIILNNVNIFLKLIPFVPEFFINNISVSYGSWPIMIIPKLLKVLWQ